MLDDKSVTKEALLKELDFFIKVKCRYKKQTRTCILTTFFSLPPQETEKKQKAAKSNADAWDQLRLDVLSYQKTIEHAFSVANAGVDKTAVKNEIARLESKIAEAQKFVSPAWIFLILVPQLTMLLACSFVVDRRLLDCWRRRSGRDGWRRDSLLLLPFGCYLVRCECAYGSMRSIM